MRAGGAAKADGGGSTRLRTAAGATATPAQLWEAAEAHLREGRAADSFNFSSQWAAAGSETAKRKRPPSASAYASVGVPRAGDSGGVRDSAAALSDIFTGPPGGGARADAAPAASSSLGAQWLPFVSSGPSASAADGVGGGGGAAAAADAPDTPMDTEGGGTASGTGAAAATASGAPPGPSLSRGLTLLQEQNDAEAEYFAGFGPAAAAASSGAAGAKGTDGAGAGEPRPSSDFLADRLGGGGGVYSRDRPAMPALSIPAGTINPLSCDDVVKSPPPPEDMSLEITEEPRPVPATSALRALSAAPHPGAAGASGD
eukprot:contig_37295_g8785